MHFYYIELIYEHLLDGQSLYNVKFPILMEAPFIQMILLYEELRASKFWDKKANLQKDFLFLFRQLGLRVYVERKLLDQAVFLSDFAELCCFGKGWFLKLIF